MSALPPRVSISLFVHGSGIDPLHSVFVENDLQSLHAHMIACATSRSVLSTLRRVYEAALALLLPRIVTGVVCAAGLGLVAGGVLSLIFPV